MKHRILIGIGIALFFLFGLAVGFTRAQDGGSDKLALLAGSPSDTFTYQGTLEYNGQPANGIFDFKGTVWDAASGGTQLDSCGYMDNIQVTNGLFNLMCALVHPDSTFTGEARYFQVEVKANAAVSYTTLPRQAMTAVPYAFGLRPGSVINGYSNTRNVLEINDTDTNLIHDALWVSGQTTLTTSNTGVMPLVVYNPNHDAVNVSGNLYVYDGIAYVEGNLTQARDSFGTVKAGAYVNCGTSALIIRSFNSQGYTITIANGVAAGQCTVDFGFDISDRYVVATAGGFTAARGMSCYYNGGDISKLDCLRYDAAGNGMSGAVWILIY